MKPSRDLHSLLRSVRYAKTIGQLEDVYMTLAPLLRDRVSSLEAPAPPHRAKQSTTEALTQCSVLVAAFCRRAEYLVNSRFTYADVDTSTRSGSATQLQECMAELQRLLKSVDTAAVAKRLGAPAVSSQFDVLGAVGCITAYGMGEVKDYSIYRRVRVLHFLQNLVSQPHWDTTAVTQAICTLSEVSRDGLDSFALLSSEEELEATSVAAPLRDPISQALIKTPARGAECTHIDLFDVESFVRAAQQRVFRSVDAGASCPICSKMIQLSGLRVDLCALAAMRAYQSAGLTLNADCSLEWNRNDRSVTVKASPHGYGDGQSEEVPSDDDEHDASVVAASEEEAAKKKRRVDIGGHVLYTDD